MPDILALLQPLHPLLTLTTIRHLHQVTSALLAMTGRVTMLGLSRWTTEGGSYRTLQRFLATAISWAPLLWLFFRQHLFQANDTYILAGDEVVVTKAGKTTFGLDRFFAGLYQKPVPGLAFFSLALVSTNERRAYPLCLEQVVGTDEEKAASKAKALAKKTNQQAPKRKPGRPKGSPSKPKAEVSLSPELQRIQTLLHELLGLLGDYLPLVYLALDGHFGNRFALQMVRECGLHIISKLRGDAALYFPYEGPYQGRGPRRNYGDKVDWRTLPDQYLRETTVEEQVETRVYQAELLHKEFPQAVNVVIVVKRNLRTQACAHAIVFSSDLTLGSDKVLDYYSLRFQLEFVFREAKQFWGLEDFMNVGAVGVRNAANLSMLMVNLVAVLLREVRQREPQCSVLDLKASYRGSKYVSETLKLLPERPDQVLIEQIIRQVASLGRIHPPDARLNAA